MQSEILVFCPSFDLGCTQKRPTFRVQAFFVLTSVLTDLVKPDGIAKPYPSSDFWGNIFNKRYVVKVKLIR